MYIGIAEPGPRVPAAVAGRTAPAWGEGLGSVMSVGDDVIAPLEKPPMNTRKNCLEMGLV